MTVQEVVKFLKEKGGWYCTQDIAERLGRGVNCVRKNIRVALRWGDVEVREILEGKRNYHRPYRFYRYKNESRRKH